jgi:hypothetical protein
MPHYNGKMGNSEFGQHTTAIEGTELLIETLSKMQWKNRIKLGIIEGRRPKKPFLNCTITETSLIFKLGASSVQTIAVTINGTTPMTFFETFEKEFKQPMRVRTNLEK